MAYSPYNPIVDHPPLDQMRKNFNHFLIGDCDAATFRASITAVRDVIEGMAGDSSMATVQFLDKLKIAVENTRLDPQEFLKPLSIQVMDSGLKNFNKLYDLVERNFIGRLSEDGEQCQRSLSSGSESSNESTPVSSPGICSTLERKLGNVLIWCSELWLIKSLKECSDDAVKGWICEKYKDLFKLYIYAADDPGERYKDVIDLNCVDLLKNIFDESIFKDYFNKVLNDSSKVCQLTMHPMRRSMMLLLNQNSNDKYLIPKPDLREESKRMKMYAINITITSKSEETVKKAVNDQAYQLAAAEKLAGFKVIPVPEDKPPNHTNIQSLFPWLKRACLSIQDRCSFLLLTVYSHGAARHIRGADYQHTEIIQLLEVLNTTEKLRDIPKVVVIQACQHYPLGNVQIFDHSTGYCDSLRIEEDPTLSLQYLMRLPESNIHHTHLILSVQEGEFDDSILPFTFMRYFAKHIGESAGNETTIREISTRATGEYKRFMFEELDNPYGLPAPSPVHMSSWGSKNCHPLPKVLVQADTGYEDMELSMAEEEERAEVIALRGTSSSPDSFEM